MNKQLTAMQELIEWLYDEDNIPDSFEVIKKSKQLLSKEKKQIQQAYHDGFMKSEISYLSHTLPIPQVLECTEQYYQNTYQNN